MPAAGSSAPGRSPASRARCRRCPCRPAAGAAGSVSRCQGRASGGGRAGTIPESDTCCRAGSGPWGAERGVNRAAGLLEPLDGGLASPSRVSRMSLTDEGEKWWVDVGCGGVAHLFSAAAAAGVSAWACDQLQPGAPCRPLLDPEETPHRPAGNVSPGSRSALIGSSSACAGDHR